MSDLVTRLREDCLNPRLSDEAADEIERLQHGIVAAHHLLLATEGSKAPGFYGTLSRWQNGFAVEIAKEEIS